MRSTGMLDVGVLNILSYGSYKLPRTDLLFLQKATNNGHKESHYGFSYSNALLTMGP